MASIYDMDTRRQQWMSEKPQWDGNSNEWRPQPNDLLIFHFVANGDEGDRFLKVYRSHIIQKAGKDASGKETFFSEARYCPIQSGEPELPCPLCEAGHTEIKERMSMWLDVDNILHAQLPRKMPEGKVFPQVVHENRMYFNEEVNGFKLWHTSAWRDSPWPDILKNYEIYKGLHNFVGNIQVVGERLQRRFKLYALPYTPFLAPERYSLAQQECTPIIDILHAEINSPVQINPQQVQQQAAPVPQFPSLGQIQPFVAPGTQAPVFQMPTTAEPNPAPEPTSVMQQQPSPTQVESQPEQTAEDERRPMKKLF